ncbi:TPA: phage tail protein [Pseudomonas aeruginosa]|uniref:phage tail-collar fiber domain-containing protein n=1 Tax=Pseudomonas aeruginosa TaxID=287 RepID=UPI00053E09B5|nr:phage tail protein [Pseudomonas aeruginosa]HCL3991276.1 phage tail protein [Pseudomonas aeruginosa]
MIDQNSQFFAILTDIGAAKQANADALGIPWKLTQMGVGDANGTDPIPSAAQTKLINERRRAPLNQLKVDPKNAAVIIAEQVIPENIGGWWIREIGLYDADNDLVAVANCAPSFKPILSQGSGRTQVVRLNLIVSSSANIELKIDPSVVLATRQYVDSSILNVLPATRKAGTFTKVKVNNRGIVEEGANPTTLEGYGITDALARGAYGLGGSLAPAAPIDKIGMPGGFYSYGSGVTSFTEYCGLINIPYSSAEYSAQLGFKQGTAEPAIYIRSTKQDGSWTPTRTLWHSGNFNPGNYATKATTLAGYAISDAYTKTETDNKLAEKANKATTLAGYGITDALGKNETAVSATKLATPRTIAISGAGSGSAAFDGGSNVNIALTLADSGVIAGSYPKVTVSAKGVVTAGAALSVADVPSLPWSKINSGKPTTLGGYGITDALARGDFGIGTNIAPNTPIDTIGLPGGFYSYGDGPTSFARYSCLVNIPYGRNDYAAQIGFKQGTTEPTVLVRSVLNDGGSWTPTRELWHNGNLDMVGAVVAFACSNPPAGFLIANGAAISRATYPELFARIGTTYGTGNGSTTFNLPDYRGEFIRGVDLGRGVDPGRAFGSLQLDALQAHTHVSVVTAIGLSGGTGEFSGAAGSPGGTRVTDRVVEVSGARVATETRSRNVAALICIKY